MIGVFFLGLVVGCVLGVFAMALAVAARDER